MAGYTHHYVTPKNVRFHYLEWGDPAAPPVVLLHGTSGNAHSWDMVSPVLAKKYRVLALDCRDHGESGDSDGPFYRDVLVQDVLDILDALQLPSVGMVGLSMGGGTAMSFAGMYPERVNRLVIEDIGPEVPAEGSARVRARLGGMPTHFDSLDDLVAYNRQSKVNASDAWMTYLAELSTRPTLEGRRELKYRTRPLKPGETAPQSKINTWEVIKHITAPTLIVRGDESDILNEDITNRMLAVIKDSRAVVISKAGHVVHEDNPEEYIGHVAAFFGID